RGCARRRFCRRPTSEPHVQTEARLSSVCAAADASPPARPTCPRLTGTIVAEITESSRATNRQQEIGALLSSILSATQRQPIRSRRTGVSTNSIYGQEEVSDAVLDADQIQRKTRRWVHPPLELMQAIQETGERSGTGRVLADTAGLQSEPSAPVVTGVSIRVRRVRRRVERKQS